MSAEISPLLVRTPAAARPLWLRQIGRAHV